MKYLWATCLLIAALSLPATKAHPPGGSRLDRLARLVMPNRHSLALARSLDSYSSLARRQGGDDPTSVADIGTTDFEDAEDEVAIGKRQFDDYGHMRFGRNTGGASREKKYDDYGHMRYGK